jgi:UDP-N-acetylglucosamine 1-carboxyvinyltransferase
MSTLLIEGGQRLSGSVEVEGNKNSALPLLAACLLTTEECILTNVPRISDVEVMARLLLDVGPGGWYRQHHTPHSLSG